MRVGEINITVDAKCFCDHCQFFSTVTTKPIWADLDTMGDFTHEIKEAIAESMEASGWEKETFCPDCAKKPAIIEMLKYED
jgi:hypothetical protein